jgi:hypothetical protein
VSTKANEFRDEYFSRILYANEHFSTPVHPEGWLTDRGEVYIKMGPPKNIEQLTLQSRGNTLEVWDYWESHGTTLFFLDYSGQGDIYLINPGELEGNFYYQVK